MVYQLGDTNTVGVIRTELSQTALVTIAPTQQQRMSMETHLSSAALYLYLLNRYKDMFHVRYVTQ